MNMFVQFLCQLQFGEIDKLKLVDSYKNENFNLLQCLGWYAVLENLLLLCYSQ